MWLDCANVEAEVAAALIRPADDALLEAYPVSTAVNRVANDSEVLIAPAPLEACRGNEFRRARGQSGKSEKLRKAKEPDGQASLF